MGDATLQLNSLQSITRGATVFIVGLGVMNVAGFGLNFLLTRSLGAEQYGIYAYTLTLLGVVVLVTPLGSDISVLKYIPEFEHQPQKQRSLLGLAYLTAFLGGGTVAVLLFVAAPQINAKTLADPLFVDILRLFSVVIVLSSVGRIIHSTFRGLELLEYEVLTTKVVKPLANLACVAIALWVGMSLYGVMVALVIAAALVFGFAIYLLIRVSSRRNVMPRRISRQDVRNYYHFTLPLTLSGTGQFFTNRVDILLVGFVLSSAAVGVYNIALLFASALLIPLAAFNQLFPPVASRLHANAKSGELNAIFGIVTRWSFTVSFPVALIVVVFRHEFLAIFGQEFVNGAGVLVLLVFGHLVNSATGPADYLLMMTNHQYVSLLNKLGFGLLNLVVTYRLILAFGLFGAGLGTAIVLVAFNLTKLTEIWYFERLYPYSPGFLKPLVAGGVSAFAMSATRAFFHGLQLIGIGTAVGVVVYVGTLVAFGIDAADKRFAQHLLAEASVSESKGE